MWGTDTVRTRMQERAGLGLGFYGRLHLSKEHSSISCWSTREFSFAGETLGSDLLGLG